MREDDLNKKIEDIHVAFGTQFFKEFFLFFKL